MGWTGEVFVQEGYPNGSADNTVEASIVSLAGGIIVAAGYDNDWNNVTFRAFRADGNGGLDGGPVASYNGYPDGDPNPNPNGTNGDPNGMTLAFDDMNKFVQVDDYIFAWVGEASQAFVGVGGAAASWPTGTHYIVAQFLTVNPTTLAITRTGRAYAPATEFYADEVVAAAYNGKLLVMSGSNSGSATNYLALAEPAGDTAVTYLVTPTTHNRMGPIAVSGNKAIYWDDDVPGWYYVNLPAGGGGLLTADNMGMDYSWAWFTKTLVDGRIAVIITGTVGADGTGDPLKLVIFDADLAGGYDGPYDIATTAKNVGWTGGWYSNVRSIDEFPNGDLLIGWIVGSNQPWLARVNATDGSIIKKWQPTHNTNVANCWNYEIATFKTNNTDFLLMWAGFSDGGNDSYRLLVAGSGESFGLTPTDPFREDFENGSDGARVTTTNTHFVGIDFDEDPWANDADIYFDTDSHSGNFSATSTGNYSLQYPYTSDPAVLITGDPESGTFWMKVKYADMLSGQKRLFAIATGNNGEQILDAGEQLTLYRFDGETQLQWEDHTYDTPVVIPDNTWFKVEWSITGPAYTIKISDGANIVWLDIAKDMDDDGFNAPYYKLGYVTFYLSPGVFVDDVNVEPAPCLPLVDWWTGGSLLPLDLMGWWDGAAFQSLELMGWWDSNSIEPLLTTCSGSEPPVIPDTWNTLNLSTVEFYDGTAQYGSVGPTAAYNAGRIEAPGTHTGAFYIPGIVLPDYTKQYEFEFTLELISGTQTFVSIKRTLANTQAAFDNSDSAPIVYLNDSASLVRLGTVGPGISDWNVADALSWNYLDFYIRANNAVTQIRWRQLP